MKAQRSEATRVALHVLWHGGQKHGLQGGLVETPLLNCLEKFILCVPQLLHLGGASRWQSWNQITSSLGPGIETLGKQLLSKKKEKKSYRNQEEIHRKATQHQEIEDNSGSKEEDLDPTA